MSFQGHFKSRWPQTFPDICCFPLIFIPPWNMERECRDHYRLGNWGSKKERNPGPDPSFAFPPPVLSLHHLLPGALQWPPHWSLCIYPCSLPTAPANTVFRLCYSSAWIPTMGLRRGENQNPSNSLHGPACSPPSFFHLSLMFQLQHHLPLILEILNYSVLSSIFPTGIQTPWGRGLNCLVHFGKSRTEH